MREVWEAQGSLGERKVRASLRSVRVKGVEESEANVLPAACEGYKYAPNNDRWPMDFLAGTRSSNETNGTNDQYSASCEVQDAERTPGGTTSFHDVLAQQFLSNVLDDGDVPIDGAPLVKQVYDYRRPRPQVRRAVCWSAAVLD